MRATNPELLRTIPLMLTSLMSSPGTPAGRTPDDLLSLPRPSRLMNGSRRPSGSYENGVGGSAVTTGWVAPVAAGDAAGVAGLRSAGCCADSIGDPSAAVTTAPHVST